MQEWIQTEIASLVTKYSTVPPPWVMYNEHPYSICWRMGGGESHLMLWWEWWPQQWTEGQKIEYFRKWPPPPCWLVFLIEAIWNVDAFEDEDTERLMPYFNRTSDLGFGGRHDYERDIEDPKWLVQDE